jgi:signal transduction histidine kinase
MLPRWPIRTKLLIGLSVVVSMMSLLMGGSIFGLRAFHDSKLTMENLLRELGGATDLLHAVRQVDEAPARRAFLAGQVETARAALMRYHEELERNLSRGNRADDGRDEFGLVSLIDDDLTALLALARPDQAAQPLLPRTELYLSRHPELRLAHDPEADPSDLLHTRLERLYQTSDELPHRLYQDYRLVLDVSRSRYESSRVIVWVGALTVLALLVALALLVHRWVLHPVRLLQRGVRRVARGQFDYHIELHTGDEMQALAEAFNDMTSRLSATYADLERQIGERSRQLVRSERLASVGFLAAGVAHEINNPLAAIAFSSEALETRLDRVFETAEDGSPSADERTVRKYLRMIQEEAFRCKGITEKLLDFSRCHDIQRQRTDLVELVQSVVEMIQHMGKYRGKTIAFQPREAVFAHVDPQEIKQVVLNLVVNALDCMETEGTLRIQMRNVEGMAEATFIDDGCGMPPEVLENIFEPFFTRRRVGKGTGLGLSITHRIVTQHHGEIGATSEGEGQGSTFIVRLPIQPHHEPSGDPLSGSGITPHSRLAAGAAGSRRGAGEHDPSLASWPGGA